MFKAYVSKWMVIGWFQKPTCSVKQMLSLVKGPQIALQPLQLSGALASSHSHQCVVHLQVSRVTCSTQSPKDLCKWQM